MPRMINVKLSVWGK